MSCFSQTHLGLPPQVPDQHTLTGGDGQELPHLAEPGDEADTPARAHQSKHLARHVAQVLGRHPHGDTPEGSGVISSLHRQVKMSLVLHEEQDLGDTTR